MTTKQDLMKIKSRALRTKVWFKALSKVERAIVDLTVRCVDNVRSTTLARTISTIIDKILQCLEQDFMTRAERIGQEIAESLCALGTGWGNKASSSWKFDKRFIKFLGVSALNT